MDDACPSHHIPTARLDALCWRPGLIAIRGAQVDVREHAHHALQLSVPLFGSQSLWLDGEPLVTDEALLLGSGIRHRLRGSDCLILLIEPQSHLGQWFSSEQLAGRQWRRLPSVGQALDEHTSVDALLTSLLCLLGAPVCRAHHLDPRIVRCLEIVSRELDVDGGSQLSAAGAAAQVALSTSRFQHLFSAQMGIAWRPYLLWRRLLLAVQLVVGGASLTQGAHRAGFADAAHFSRTFKAMFGVTAKKVLSSLVLPSP